VITKYLYHIFVCWHTLLAVNPDKSVHKTINCFTLQVHHLQISKPSDWQL